MNTKAELTKREWLLLSAYLDGQLSAKEERQVEELLQTKAASREALEALGRTRQVLKHVPTKSVPRNFTLTPEMVQKPLLPSFSRVLSYSSVLAGLFLVVVIALDFYSGAENQTMGKMTAVESQTLLSEETSRTVDEEAPEILNWGASKDGVGGYGMGGGGEAFSAPGYGIGGGEAADVVPELEIAPEAEVDETEGYAAESLQAQPKESEDGLIMGVRPADEQGEILSMVPPEDSTEDSAALSPENKKSLVPADFPWRLVELALAVATLFTGLMAFLFKKHH